ncbi:MAG TPA: restriction endonuclease [Symbiobacteriaceae bacterium]|nr:restriction endonuclease [Symbiobacteriaceae bacterium]
MNPYSGLPKALWDIMLSFWPLWLLLVAVLLITSIPEFYRRWRLSQAGMDQVDRMGGIEFEEYLETLFRKLGYKVVRTPASGDQGADLILTGNGERIAVQAKRWNKRIGNKAVQEITAARLHYGCDRAMVVSNQEFTPAARELAASTQTELWGRQRLADQIIALKSAPTATAGSTGPHPKAEVIPTPIVTQTTARTCPRCGGQLVKRQSKRGPFWGCSTYPRCRYTEEP